MQRSRRARRSGRRARRRQPGAPRADGAHLPRQRRARSADDFDEDRWTIHPDKLGGVKLPLTVQDAVQARIAALSARRAGPARAGGGDGQACSGSAGSSPSRRQARRSPEMWEGGEAADVLVIRASPLRSRRARLRPPPARQHLRRRRGVRLQAQPRARGARAADAAGIRTPLPPRDRRLALVPRERRRQRGVPRDARPPPREGRAPSLAASASYVQAARRRALALREREGRRALRAGARAARRRRCVKVASAPDPTRKRRLMRALHHHGDVLQALGRNDDALRAFVEMLTRAWRLDLGARAGRRIRASAASTGRRADSTRPIAPSHGRARALRAGAGRAAASASTLDDIGKLHWLKGDYALALEYTLRGLAMRRKLGDRRASRSRLNNLGLVQQDSGNYQGARSKRSSRRSASAATSATSWASASR